jgi:phytoene dehydrogenase-like protein
MKTAHHDLIVAGAGSGGFGAALAAARLGQRVLLVEKSDWLGGNAARCGVNVWETGVGGTGIPFDLYKRLKKSRTLSASTRSTGTSAGTIRRPVRFFPAANC